MTRVPQDLLELTEFSPSTVTRERLPDESVRELLREYGKQVRVEHSSLFSDDWSLTPLGWVGYIPLLGGLSISLQPKVQLSNLFRMLEYAYSTDFLVLEGIMGCQSLTEFYERLANILAKRVLARARKGFYRAYIAETDRLPYVRGRLDVSRAMRVPWDVQLECHFQDHTGDIEDNQILAWTLHTIARTGLCSERVLPTVRKAYRGLQGLVELKALTPESCVKRLYHRLNEDYQPLHGLCRFFLEHTGPTNRPGDKSMLPFLINMALLFERFVAAWLKRHLPGRYRLKAQERVEVADGVLRFDIDLVLYDASKNEPLCVLDTKYKTDLEPAKSDIEQVVTYSLLKNCHQAVLVYPTKAINSLNANIRDIHVQSTAFSLDGDLDSDGYRFLSDLGLT